MKKHPSNGAGARARMLRTNMTDAERRVWQVLRSHQLNGYKFRRQAPIGRYIADFVCREARLIVEIDGCQHDPSSSRDVERSVFLQNERILRFWNNEVLENLDGVYETIANELGRITPTQTLPHRGGGLSGPGPQPSPFSKERHGRGLRGADGAQIPRTLPLDGGGLGGGDLSRKSRPDSQSLKERPV